MISETDLAELIVPHTLTDPVTFHLLAQVSKRFYYVSKKKLIRKKIIDPDGSKGIWTELPNGTLHGLCRGWGKDGQQWYKKNYNQGELHGLSRGWFFDGQICSESNYDQGKLHGLQRSWSADGRLRYKRDYNQGQLIEKSSTE
jgi:antitoxin component YwqK of YwqJK toxin-antitoxin module